MNVFPSFPSRPNWTSHDLADAMPLRLLELYRFDVGAGTDAANAGQASRRRPRDWHGRYQPTPPLPTLFRIHN
ncbi:MAG: hypothetical protein KY442_01885 [Proteobacteria bacterium]|nr:hypothetical protein [Pseudomonadota bacterium]